jgi:hypothetical protein
LEVVRNILRTHRIGQGDIDYRSFFRSKLTEVKNETAVLSTSNSIFRISPGTQSRVVGPAHPWEFHRYAEGTSPHDQLRGHTSSGPSIQQLKFPSTGDSSHVRAAWTIGQSDPNLISLLQRLSAHPQSHQLSHHYQRNSLPSHDGYISNKCFQSSLKMIQFPLKKAEFNLLVKEFRAIGLPDSFHYQRMLDLMKGL